MKSKTNSQLSKIAKAREEVAAWKALGELAETDWRIAAAMLQARFPEYQLTAAENSNAGIPPDLSGFTEFCTLKVSPPFSCDQ